MMMMTKTMMNVIMVMMVTSVAVLCGQTPVKLNFCDPHPPHHNLLHLSEHYRHDHHDDGDDDGDDDDDDDDGDWCGCASG